MRDFGYDKRAKAVEDARADVDVTARALVDRWNPDDPRTERWRRSIAMFRAAYDDVYDDVLRRVDRGEAPASAVTTEAMLDFLEADPIFFRSGYMKERLLRVLKRRSLDACEAARLREIILAVVEHANDRREFRAYCRAATNVDDEAFRHALEMLERSGNARAQQRANWVLAALAGKWLDLKRAARGHQRVDGYYVQVPRPLIER